MTLGERVYLYCERGTNEALWAEPINAISNAGFFLAALIFWQLVLWRPPEQHSADHYLFVALTFLIGFGSLAFHLYADRGTELADIVPIGVFMLVYLGFALNRFLAVPPGWTVFLVIVFAGVVGASMQVHCWDGGIGFAGGAPDAKVCLNGSVGYLPALAALILVGMVLAERRHRAAPYVLCATLLFAGSILLRSLDMSFCDRIVIEGRSVGTHFIWHLLNALVLFFLLRATLETGTKPQTAKDVSQDSVEDKPVSVVSKPEEAEAPKPEPAKSEPAKSEPPTTESPKAETKDAEPTKAAEPEAEAPAETKAKPKPKSKAEAKPKDDAKKEALLPEEDKGAGDDPDMKDDSGAKDDPDSKTRSS